MVALAMVMTGAALAACSNDAPGLSGNQALSRRATGTRGLRGGPADSPVAPDGGTADACTQCLDGASAAGGACDAAVKACGANKACSNLDQCINACQDDACAKTCEMHFAAGVTLYNQLNSCLNTACQAACTDPCTTCEQGSVAAGGACATQAQACGSGSACESVDSCLNACAANDVACASGCEQANAAGTQALKALVTCVQTACASTCEDPCTVCQDQALGTSGACDMSAQACINTPDCLKLNDCLNACNASDTACPNTCETQFPAGVQPLNAVVACLQTSCSMQCGQ
jgi:hypothetical protein